MRQGWTSLIDTLDQKTESQLFSMALSLGLTNKLSLSASLPVIINRSVNKILDQTDTNIGDLALMGRIFLSPRLMSKSTNLQISLGASLPVSSGIKNVMTVEMNFASGTIDPIANIILAVGISPGWNVTTKAYTRKVIATSSRSETTGDYYSYSVETVYAPLGQSYTANTGIEIIKRGQDRIEGHLFSNSGGNWIFAKLGGSKAIIGTGESALRFWSEFQFPVYLNVRGVQLTEKWNFRFGVTTGLSLFGHSANDDEHGLLEVPSSEN